jgi:hypothetical protein
MSGVRLIALAVVAGCSAGAAAPDASQPAGCFTGDAGSDPELTLVQRTPDGQLAAVADGELVWLVEPPQGGEVLLLGVRARNIDGCPLTLSTSLVVPGTTVVAAFERRPVSLEVAPDGWLQPRRPDVLSNFANLPSCPIAGLDRAVDGESYRVTIEVEDLAGHKGEVSATVVPTCGMNVAPERCRCLCAAGYVLGSVCP